MALLEYQAKLRAKRRVLREARDEAMRKARNCAAYAHLAETDLGRQRWREGACELAREARRLNRDLLAVR